MPIEWLVAAGCVRTVVSGLVSLEGFGLAPRFRAAVQAHEVEIEEYSEHTLICRLQAAAYRIPYMPTKAGLGTDMLALHPETTREQADPATGEPLCRLHAAPGRRRDRPRRGRRHARQRPRRPEARLDGLRARQGCRNDDRDGRAHRPRGELPRRAAPHDLPALHGRHRRRGALGGLPDLVLPALLATTATSSAPTPPRTPTPPPVRPSGASGSSAPRRTPRSWTRTAAPRTLLSIARRTS